MNSKMYKTGFFVLLVINIALVILFVSGPKPPPQESGIKDEISRELGFTEEQKVMFDQMAINHREAIRELENKERELVRSLFEELALENTPGDKEELLHKIVQLERDKIAITYNHFEELKGICNEEQLTKFNRVIEQVVPLLTNSSAKPMKPDKPPF